MKILIVDDSKISRIAIKSKLEGSYHITEAENFEEALAFLNTEPFDICFIDLNLGDEKELEGLGLIPIAVQNGVYSVVMSAYEADDVIQKAYDLGCKDYYAKGNEKENVTETVRRYYDSKESFTEELVSEIFPTKNPAQKKAIKDLAPVISSNIPICLYGRTGSGKSFLAEGIHKLSKRSGNFIEVNCGAISEELLEAELFGYARGAFTGATEGKSGKILLANGGTLFLDEIGSMPESMQVKLLKVLDSGRFYPVNSDKMVHSDFRLICAGLSNLPDLVRRGVFRADLFQRISGYSITLMPLCERPEDIMPTIRQVTASTRRIVFSKDAKEFIEAYSWPGNVRQVIHFSEVLSRVSSGVVSVEQVKACISETSSSVTQGALVTDEHLRLIKDVGLQEFLNMMRDEAIKLGLKNSGGSGRDLLSEFKMSSATLHRFKKANPKLKESMYEVQ